MLKGQSVWWVQRITGLLILAFIVVLVWQAFTLEGLMQWHQWLRLTWVRWLCFAVSLSLAFHAWYGLWTVITDYIHHKLTRYFSFLFVLAVLCGSIIESLWIALGVV